MASTLCFTLITFLFLASSQYGSPEPLFLNCGSKDDIKIGNLTFVHDTHYFSGDSTAVKNSKPASNVSTIYDTARVFTKKSWYELKAEENNTFVMNVENDTLRRNWSPDDPFIFNPELATNSSSTVPINYKDGTAQPHHAPEFVYRTAKQLKNNSFNITWNFGVNKNATYLVRAHFCDFISHSLTTGAFKFFIYINLNETIYPSYRSMYSLAAPFFADWVVDPVESRFVNISIGGIAGSNQTAFLNGIEIMELLKYSGVNDQPYHYGKAKLNPRSHVMLSYGGDSYTDLNIDPSTAPHLSLNLRIPFRDILKATNNFDKELIIGQGGFGKVYKGTLLNGRKVAVKRGEKGHGQGWPEFVTEITVLSKIRHRHLVSLVVADFGISRFGNVDDSEISGMKGSFGYMDPEYAIYMKVTQKSDVYAFGVVLLEVLCARPVLNHKEPQTEVNLADWAKKQIKDGNVEKMIDPFLAGTINTDSLRVFLSLVEWCLKDLGDERPTMIEVKRDLEYALEFQQMVDDKEFPEDSTTNTSLQFPMSVLKWLPSGINDESEVNDSSSSSSCYPSQSQVFSQLRMQEAR
ncbi:hypothetical protein L1887_36199 [Cichorium endivia]|nr:hypothetical protein L1887_36199 [Cichorium endivia]